MKEKKFRFEDNAYDLLRYWAAIGVMVGHFMWKLQIDAPTGSYIVRAITRIFTFFPGVVILFSMSGFLIAASYERSQNRKEFFIKRVLRMYPELWVCTIVNLIVVCVLAFELLDKSIFIWLITQIFGIANTPSCLKSFATGSINGALWTIFTEIQLYIVLGITYNWLKHLNTKKWCILLIALAVINVFADFVADGCGGVIAKIIERFFLTYALWFFIGVFCYVKREQIIPLLKKLIPVMLAAYVIFDWISIYTLADIPGYYANIVIGILLPFIVIGGGIASRKSICLAI